MGQCRSVHGRVGGEGGTIKLVRCTPFSGIFCDHKIHKGCKILKWIALVVLQLTATDTMNYDDAFTLEEV